MRAFRPLAGKFAILVFLTILWAGVQSLLACGGANASGGGNTPAVESSGRGGSSADAGPTTTTTIALGDGGDLQGTKLGSSSTATVETTVNDADGGQKRPHQQEPGRSARDIQAIVVSRRDEARACYDNALKGHPGIEGDLDIQWAIDPKGNVSDISLDQSRSQILEPGVANCVIAIIKRIHFNESARGFETRTHYPFNFHPRSGGVMVVRSDAGP